MTYDVTLIPGDGIGPEVTAETVKVLEKTGLKFHWDEQAAGADALERRGILHPRPIREDPSYDKRVDLR